MTGTLTCPRVNPDIGDRCGEPLPDDYGYRPCPACTADIARRHAAAFWLRCCAVADALAQGYVINEAGDAFVLPKDDEPEGEVIAGDRAGAPSRGGRSPTTPDARARRPDTGTRHRTTRPT